jgi:hypothetical protein
MAGGILILTAFALGAQWMKTPQGTKPLVHVGQDVLPAKQINAQQQREYVLEVIGLGVTLDKYRQGKLWEALQTAGPQASIRESDPMKYPWSEMDKAGVGGGRGGDSLENGVGFTPMYFGVPVLNAAPEAHNEYRADLPNGPMPGLVGGAMQTGFSWHLFVVGPRRFGEQPDRILEDVFAFFDAHPDVPYIVLNSEDSLGTRDSNRPNGTPPLLKDGHYVTEKPDASALFVLARRERVDPVRPYVWDDPENGFLQKQFRWMYCNLMSAVPNVERNRALLTPAQVGADMSHQTINEVGQRQPFVSEWLEAAAAFAQRPDVRGTGVVGLLNKANPLSSSPPTNWKPTPWFPIPWNREQLETFDRLPTLGYIHRPTYVRFTDQTGKPVTRRDERLKLMQAGWQFALQTLPEQRRTTAPSRVIAATADDPEKLIALHRTLDAHAAAGGPEIDASTARQFIDTDKRLGDTGAATLFVQMGIGIMGSYRDGGVSAAINWRSQDEASIVLISPPTDEQRKNQRHPQGGDVFAHRGTPAIDPAAYP